MALVSLKSPIGTLSVHASDRGIDKIELDRRNGKDSPNEVTETAVAQLEAYFAGELENFDLPLDLTQLTDFQREVLSALAKVPYGKTISYGELAEQIGKPGAARAVGGALNRNPLPLVLPCHRIVGSDGSLTGFASGTDNKRLLLELERAPLAVH